MAGRRAGAVAGHVLHVMLRVLAWIVARLPFAALPHLGALLGGLAGGVLRIRRAHVVAAMARAGIGDARDGAPTPATHASARAMYRALGTSIFELLWLAGRGARAAGAVAAIAPSSQLALARARTRADGRGVVFAASHTGNWDLAACAFAGSGELLVVTKRLSVQGVDAFWQRTRAGAGVHLVEAAGALTAARASLRRGGSVAMMIDQVPAAERHAERVPFLGADAWVDRAPATLAAQMGVPLVVSASRRDPSGKHVMEVLAVLEPPGRGGARASAEGRAAWAARATREATLALERFVRAHPSEWLWMHRRWAAPRLSPRAGIAMPLPCTTPVSPAIPSSSQAVASRAASS